MNDNRSEGESDLAITRQVIRSGRRWWIANLIGISFLITGCGASQAISASTLTLTPSPQPTINITATSTPVRSTPGPATPGAGPLSMEFSGAGNADLMLPAHESSLLHISGNSAGHRFSVSSYNERGEVIATLVDTLSPYEGVRPLDFSQDEQTARLKVEAEGTWKIQLQPLSGARRVQPPARLAGSGDDVVIVRPGDSRWARIVGNSSAKPFQVTAYFDDTRVEVMADTAAPMDKASPVSGRLVALVVMAVGPWSIDLYNGEADK